jgi:hypothetical protein
MPAIAINDWKELANRAGDGLEISLFWSKSADRVRVTVSDERFEERFDLDVANSDALAAFHHPFAYAAVRSLGFTEDGREPVSLRLQG